MRRRSEKARGSPPVQFFIRRLHPLWSVSRSADCGRLDFRNKGSELTAASGRAGDRRDRIEQCRIVWLGAFQLVQDGQGARLNRQQRLKELANERVTEARHVYAGDDEPAAIAKLRKRNIEKPHFGIGFLAFA